MAYLYPQTYKYAQTMKQKNFLFNLDIGQYDFIYTKLSNEFIDVIYYKFKGKEYFYGVGYKYKKDDIVNNDIDVFVKIKCLEKNKW